MPSVVKRIKGAGVFLSCVAGGLALWAAYAPRSEALNAILALVPLLIVARRSPARRAAAAGFVFGLACWIPTLSWMLALTDNHGPWPAVVPAWLGLAAVCAGYAALFGALSARLWKGRDGAPRTGWAAVGCLFGEAVLWAGCEALRATLFSGFSWNCLGTAFSDMPYFIAPAKFGGVYLVSALCVLFNGVAATLLLRAFGARNVPSAHGPSARLCRIAETALPLAAILVVLAAGRTWRQTPATAGVRVALVQRNASCSSRRVRSENPWEIYDRLLAVAAAGRPEIVILGESAMVEFGVTTGPSAGRAAAGMLAKAGAPYLLAGGDTRTDGRVKNVLALYEGGTFVSAYAKQHLVPFGEYIPLDKTFPALQRLSPVGVSVWPGEPHGFTLARREAGVPGEKLRLGALICFEDTVAPLARRAAADGAQALVLVTNDAWFTPDADGMIRFVRGVETRQHAQQTVLRAVETGLPVIRVGNGGVTGIVAPSGRVRWLTSSEDGAPLTDAPGVMAEEVRYAPVPRRTPYVRLGDIPLWTFFAFCSIIALNRKRRQHESDQGQGC